MNKVANLLLDWSQKKVKKSEKVGHDEIKDILILTDQKLPDVALELFPKATVLFYSDKNDLPRGATPLYKSDFSYFGKIKSNQIKDLLSKDYDLFIENLVDNSPFVNYLYRHISARVKASYRPFKWVDIEMKNHGQNTAEYFEDLHTILNKF